MIQRMRKRFKFISVGCMSLALLVGISACGSQQTTLLSKVKQTKKLTVALASFPPLEYKDPKTNQWTGVDIDLLSKFAQSVGAKLDVQPMQFSASITAVQSKRDDVTANIFKTATRQKVLAFSDPMLKYEEGVIVNSKHPAITSPTTQALENKKIATCTGCAEEAFVPKIKGAVDKSYGNVNDTFLALSSGHVQVDFQPVMYAQWAIHDNPNLNIKVLGAIPESITGKGNNAPAGYYAVAKGAYSKTFLTKLNAFLVKERQNGDMQKILAKYGLTNPSYLQGLPTSP